MCKMAKISLRGSHKSQEKVLYVDTDCDTWSCPECAEKMLKLHQLRIIEATKVTLKGYWSFLTITAHESQRGHDKSLANLKRGWTKLAERLRRKYGTCHYVLIHERHEDGSLHMHMLYSHRVNKTWLKDSCRACGLGFMADSQLLRSAASAGKYVTKYLTKSISQGDQFPKRFKRVRYSIGFPRFVFETAPQDYVWHCVARGNVKSQAALDRRAGRQVTDRTRDLT